MGDHGCTCLDAAVGEQDVGSDDDACRIRTFSNPIVGLVKSTADDDAFDQRVDHDAERAVTDDLDRLTVAKGDLVDFIFYRAGIRVDKNLD